MKAKSGNKIRRGYSRHHRRPESLGGDSSDLNISIVLESKHKAWTLLFDNKDVLEIALSFEKYWSMFGDRPGPVYEAKQIGLSVLAELELLEEYKNGKLFDGMEVERIKKVLYGHRSKVKRLRAWKILFGGFATIEEMVNEINTVWIDPGYMLVVHTIQVQKVRVVSK